MRIAPSRALTIAAFAAAMSFVSACAGEPAPAETVYVTVEPAPVAPSQEPADDPSTPEATTEPINDPAAAPTADVPDEPAAETFTMPPLVGVNLQLAQDTLQALDSWLMDQEDASGLGRMQINDSNWTVCAQDPGPGSVVPVETVVTLWSVKLDETCP